MNLLVIIIYVRISIIRVLNRRDCHRHRLRLVHPVRFLLGRLVLPSCRPVRLGRARLPVALDLRLPVYRTTNWQQVINSYRMRSKPARHRVYRNPKRLVFEWLHAPLGWLGWHRGVLLEHHRLLLCLLPWWLVRKLQDAVRLTTIKYKVTAYSSGEDCWICIRMWGRADGLLLINCLICANEGLAISVRNMVYTCALSGRLPPDSPPWPGWGRLAGIPLSKYSTARSVLL